MPPLQTRGVLLTSPTEGTAIEVAVVEVETRGRYSDFLLNAAYLLQLTFCNLLPALIVATLYCAVRSEW